MRAERHSPEVEAELDEWWALCRLVAATLAEPAPTAAVGRAAYCAMHIISRAIVSDIDEEEGLESAEDDWIGDTHADVVVRGVRRAQMGRDGEFADVYLSADGWRDSMYELACVWAPDGGGPMPQREFLQNMRAESRSPARRLASNFSRGRHAAWLTGGDAEEPRCRPRIRGGRVCRPPATPAPPPVPAACAAPPVPRASAPPAATPARARAQAPPAAAAPATAPQSRLPSCRRPHPSRAQSRPCRSQCRRRPTPAPARAAVGPSPPRPVVADSRKRADAADAVVRGTQSRPPGEPPPPVPAFEWPKRRTPVAPPLVAVPAGHARAEPRVDSPCLADEPGRRGRGTPRVLRVQQVFDGDEASAADRQGTVYRQLVARGAHRQPRRVWLQLIWPTVATDGWEAQRRRHEVRARRFLPCGGTATCTL